jgi:hypothetical protein
LRAAEGEGLSPGLSLIRFLVSFSPDISMSAVELYVCPVYDSRCGFFLKEVNTNCGLLTGISQKNDSS